MGVAVESMSVRTAAVGRGEKRMVGGRKAVDIDGGHRAGHGLDIAAEEAPVAVEVDINPESRG